MLLPAFLAEFNKILGTSFVASDRLSREIEGLLSQLSACQKQPFEARRGELFRFVNAKFELNGERIQSFFTRAANLGVTFNYHEKKTVSAIFNGGSGRDLVEFLYAARRGTIGKDAIQPLSRSFDPLPPESTLLALHRELRNPTLVRKDSKPRDWSEEILTSLFSAYLYCCFPPRALHELNDPLLAGQTYDPEFWSHLHRNSPHLFSRQHSLNVAFIRKSRIDLHDTYAELRREVLIHMRNAHESVCNHGYLALIVDAAYSNDGALHWRLFADAVLYGEKHIQENVSQYFFRDQDIAESTAKHIASLNIDRAQFSRLARGFIYQDCFVIGEGLRQRLMLLFQKNVADETLIPCPACRSHNVNGNSYSSLGVRSWECKNQICPDRSKFNRGKRYSFLQLLKQQAIQDERNDIPIDSVKRWMRDVQPARSDAEILEMLIRHYTLHGDGVHLCGSKALEVNALGRKLKWHATLDASEVGGLDDHLDPEEFFDSPFFSRYLVAKPQMVLPVLKQVEVEQVKAICGDAFEVLQKIPAASVDAAVTSPPYYNAREYSQWANIYTYLYDMFNINAMVFQTLKPGGKYLFNIFDYFDNENNVSLSAMGNKRMILGAYIVDMFVRIGFRCIGNVVWDKGAIEGKRGFNNGNNSSYYQAPFNCWEHIFVFEKPDKSVQASELLPTLMKLKPVIKMVGGYNTHGHSAPYPEGIPLLAIHSLSADGVVLDPFAGSMTTGVAAIKSRVGAICIEQDRCYFQLGIKKLKEASRQPSLL